MINKSQSRKGCNFSESSLSIVFLRDIHKENLPLKAADGEQSNFDGKLKNLDESQRTVEN